MESWLLWWQAPAGPLQPPGCLLAPRLGVLLVPWTLQLAGGQSVIHTGLPIVASLANTDVSFNCKITYQHTPKFLPFTVSYFHVDLQGRTSVRKPTGCRPSLGTENQTYTLDCHVTARLPDASATGTYYCCVHWPSSTVSIRGNGTFILVRDTGYQGPPQSIQKPLLFSFTGLLTAVSVLGTALLLWKKKQRLVPEKHVPKKCSDPRSASRPPQAPTESIYTALQHQEPEVYACIEHQAGSPPSTRSRPSQESPQRFEDNSDFNLVYENL
uniref:NFAT activating protein with ITAM motif 1 n=1 Tax=Sciurus vulgaris TaxID=55149 RepID=A0A8D2AQF6_SCIVU